MKYLKAIWFWIYFPLMTLLIFSVLAVGQLFLRLFGHRIDHFAHSCAAVWARAILAFMPGWRVEISGQENLPNAGEAAVIAANHSSASDIWATYCLDLQFRWFAKDSVFRVPLIGTAMKWAGYIPVIRGNKESHHESMQQAAKCVQNNVSMFFFPEGTRSETGELRPFKIGAFKVAAEEKVAIIPVALVGAKDLLKKGSSLPGRATVRIKVMPREYRQKDEDLKDYAARVREIIINAMNSLSERHSEPSA